ncbi:MAG: glycerol-3-phosphate 1-O-acyltransferase [Deltaproteobacteria bacterium]|nr:MAG: glycerol-3-phosphate 1-O-acyltransferase [Deltaproteobacteria bacterium]
MFPELYAKAAGFVLFSYLLGSVPFGLIIAKIFGKGVDPRKVGSGNIGATNVARAVGKVGGAVTLLLDAGKGFVPLFVARRYFVEGYYPILALCGAFAFLGHIFPLYLKFRGGKGVATAFGIILYLSPVTALILVLLFIVAVILSGYVSVGSLTCAFFFPLLMAFLGPSPYYVGLSLFMAVMVFYTHRGNIRRLLEGTENRFFGKG